MGHKDIRTTMIYARLRRDLRGGTPSPADDLLGYARLQPDGEGFANLDSNVTLDDIDDEDVADFED